MYETNRGEDSAEMTDLQFAFIEYQKICVERDALREEVRALRKEGSACDERGMTDYQTKILLAVIADMLNSSADINEARARLGSITGESFAFTQN